MAIQNNIFVESSLINSSDVPAREPAPGVWKKKYDQNLTEKCTETSRKAMKTYIQK